MEILKETCSKEFIKECKISDFILSERLYSLYEQFIIDNRLVETYESKPIIDENWDRFVTEVRDSCLHQLSGWADVKSSEGWEKLRLIYVHQNKIIAGYQILIKKFPIIGKIAYLNLAPVINFHNEELVKKITTDLKSVFKKNHIKIAIISPPSAPEEIVETLKSQFERNILFNVINAEAELDTTFDENTLLKKMLRMRRQNISKRNTYDYEIVKGGEEHLETFFNLMSDTCIRNNVKPNPPSLSSVKKIWDYYHKKNFLNLYLFKINDEIVSAILAFKYQDRFIPWKFGWSGKYSSLKPNDIFHWELVKIAKQKGFKKYNLGGVNSSTAEKLVSSHKNLTERELKSATFFKMGFGCYIRKLPDSLVYISNPVLRMLYKFYLFLNKEKLVYKKKYRLNINGH
ncbi:Hypothetical protein IALB_2475 [Ignavibacterium album JCM 16511]|uniref:BioF2-like acetyltransferase domain-containing protein n=1 Tax=Ignavibacterium album (strain DSM 19864 / JCM 16511 / NBRC 101810 / Mat9-16) TaxID=945713 RepID=I0AMH1_IGNAJ|nr:peptidoglycan bridge formation glycyltransferase FemA/FemB family protein [Ignavibacterium album]AFH50178.1 Hypothetical protein IALB_2475 [Ignavibacterium album JCM 16511]